MTAEIIIANWVACRRYRILSPDFEQLRFYRGYLLPDVSVVDMKSEHLVFIKPEVFMHRILQLLVYNERTGDHDHGDDKLKNHERFTQ